MADTLAPSHRIYLDNAATSWPKPDCVYDAMDHFARDVGAAAGRGTHVQAQQSARIVERCRTLLRQLFNAAGNDRIVFCFSGTDALNLCLHGVLRPGDHVLTTQLEHNSVLRPLSWMKRHRSIEMDLAHCDLTGLIDLEDFQRRLRSNTRLVVVSHGSNVTGSVQPIEQLSRIARDAGALILVDASQTAGVWPIDFSGGDIDMLACSGHKGLLGPLGTGVAVLRSSVVDQVESFRQGGTGTLSESDEQPTEGEDKYESGNLNMHGLAGLVEGVSFTLQNFDTSRTAKHRLREALLDGLRALEHVSIYGPHAPSPCTEVVSFNVDGMHPHDVAIVLENMAQIQLRAGLHCAPWIHRALGTADLGGTVRASIGPFNTLQHVERLIQAVAQLVR